MGSYAHRRLIHHGNVIPADYDGVIAVPVSFFDKYNPEQFEIIGKIEPVCQGKRIYKRLLIKKKS